MNTFSATEERINILSHAAGLLLGVAGFVGLLVRSITLGDVWHVTSFAIFGASLVLLYAASTVYHSTTNVRRRENMRKIDHAAIYLLIAGTYTPFTLVTLRGPVGWTLFGIVWALAAIGVILKLMYAGRFRSLSTLMYVVMGWLIVFAFGPLTDAFAGIGMTFLVCGGIAYTIGAVFYSFRGLRYSHPTFHLFVLTGSICHFISVYYFVLPTPR